MHRWSVTDFEPLVGTRCRLTLASGTTLAAEITEAVALPAETSRPARLPRRAGFVVAFRAEAEETIGQQLFQVQLPQLGTFAMLMTPVSADAESTKLEAVFN